MWKCKYYIHNAYKYNVYNKVCDCVFMVPTDVRSRRKERQIRQRASAANVFL